MQLINKWTFLGIPALVIAGSFALTYAIWLILPSGEGTRVSGAAQSVVWYFLALGIQSLTYTFPFSQTMSVSRRTFFIGTTGLFAVVALGISLLYFVLGRVELATNGWGINGQLYFLGRAAESPAAVQILLNFLVMVALFMTRFWFATVYKRWRATGMLVVWSIIAVVVVGLMATHVRHPGVRLKRLQVAVRFTRVVQDIQLSGPAHSEIAKVPAGFACADNCPKAGQA